MEHARALPAEPGYIVLSTPQPVSMSNEYYQYANDNHFWIAARFRNLIPLLRSVIQRHAGLRENRWVEVGCGNAVVRNQLETTFGVPVDGIDLNEEAIRQAKAGTGNLYVYNISERKPEFDKKYDALFLMDVLEHITDEGAFLDHCFSFLKDDGLIVIHCPFSQLLWSRYDELDGHVRRYSQQRMKRVLETAGAEILQIKIWGITLVPLLLVRKALLSLWKDEKSVIKVGFKPPGRLVNAVLKMVTALEALIPLSLPFGTSIYAVARVKRPGTEI